MYVSVCPPPRPLITSGMKGVKIAVYHIAGMFGGDKDESGWMEISAKKVWRLNSSAKGC